MYKNIVPCLISIETNVKNICGSSFFANFNFYKEINQKHKFHYKILLKNNIRIPDDYDFKSGYFFVKDNVWYFERKLLFFKIKFCYDNKNKTFYFNKTYAKLFVEMGHLFPVGRHIEDFINMELFLAGYTVFRGSAFAFHGKNIALIAPSFNGKTELIKKILLNGGKYISDDITIINLEENKIYPTASFHNFGRMANKLLKNELNSGNIISKAVCLDKIIGFQNSTNIDFVAPERTFFQYLNLNSLLYFKNHFIKTYIFAENITSKIFSQIDKLKFTKINFLSLNIKNYNFDKLFNEELGGLNVLNKNHWDNLNIKYDENWKSVARQIMSRREKDLINKYLDKNIAKKILDIGVGTGRILENMVVKSDDDSEIFGLDISEEMVNVCKKKFIGQSKIKEIKICDVANEEITFNSEFDFITAIRVLKYNKNWREAIIKITNKLVHGGLVIFTMSNLNSINRFFKWRISIYRTTKKELFNIFDKNDLEILEITSFSKIPDYFYLLSNNNYYVKVLIWIEEVLEIIIGKTLFGRCFFVVAKRNIANSKPVLFNHPDSPCLICESNKHLLHVSQVKDIWLQNYPVVYCGYCKFYFLSKVPSTHEIELYYKNEYHKYSPIAYFFKKIFRNFRSSSQYYYLKKYLNLFNCSILEIGAGDGLLLSYFKDKNKVEGIEFSKKFKEFSKKRYNIDLKDQDIFKLSGKYDLIILSHVLEHLPNIDLVLKKIKGLLSSGGHLFIELPNSPLPENEDQLYLQKYLNTAHLNNFTVESLAALFKKFGFEIIANDRYYYNLPNNLVGQDKRNIASIFLSGEGLIVKYLKSIVLYIIKSLISPKNSYINVGLNREYLGFGDCIRIILKNSN